MKLDAMYTKYYNDIKILAKKIGDLVDDLPGDDEDETMEQRCISESLYRLSYALGDAEHMIEYCQKDTKEGYLKKSPYNSGRFALDDKEFGCGSPIEVLFNRNWVIGRVEADDKGYYFYGVDKPYLKDLVAKKIKVRVRV